MKAVERVSEEVRAASSWPSNLAVLALSHAERLDALAEENERLRSRIEGYQCSRDYAIDLLASALQVEADKVYAVEYYATQAKELIERLRAELATARNDALEDAAETCNRFGSSYFAEKIHALKREGGGNG
jgi:hypothetical protein